MQGMDEEFFKDTLVTLYVCLSVCLFVCLSDGVGGEAGIDHGSRVDRVAAGRMLLVILCMSCFSMESGPPDFCSLMSFMCERRGVWKVQYELPLFDARGIKSASHVYV